VQHLKLEKELDIRNFINSIAHVDNYKTILKSVKILLDKQADAVKLGVKLDPELAIAINECQARLVDERNLRFEMDNTRVSGSTHQTVQVLGDLINEATNTSVAAQYLEQGNKLSAQMSGNIKAREILEMLQEYPERIYPDPPVLDAKGKPIKQKEEKKKVKKRKRKEPPFPIPEWAVELDAVQQ